jgi:DNA-binding NarL/FixJ family response regulator
VNRDAGDALRLMVVEDELYVRRGLRAILEPLAARVEIVCEVTCSAEFNDHLESARPQVVLLDLRLPAHPLGPPDHRNGITVIRLARAGADPPKVLVLSTFRPKSDDEIVLEALAAGADGFIAKDDNFDGEQLVDALERTFAGQAIFGPSLADILRRNLRKDPPPNRLDAALSTLERNVLDQRANGANMSEIAVSLGVDERTTCNIASDIFSKARKYPLDIFRAG